MSVRYSQQAQEAKTGVAGKAQHTSRWGAMNVYGGITKKIFDLTNRLLVYIPQCKEIPYAVIRAREPYPLGHGWCFLKFEVSKNLIHEGITIFARIFFVSQCRKTS